MDMRYLRTEKHLRKACLHLREKAGIPSLTVTQLTREAEVNRITFYAHYDNVDQLVDQLEAESIQAFLQQVAPFEDFLRRPEALIRRMLEVQWEKQAGIFPRSSRGGQFTQKGIAAIIGEVSRVFPHEQESFYQRVIFAVNGIQGVFFYSGLKNEQDILETAAMVHSVLDTGPQGTPSAPL